MDAPNPISRTPLPAATAAALARSAGPLAGALVAALLAVVSGAGATAPAVAVTLLALGAGVLVAGREPVWAPLLPLMGALSRVAGPLLGGALLVGAEEAGHLPGVSLAGVGAIVAGAVVATIVAAALAARMTPPERVRVVVIGGRRSTDSLARELRLAEDVEHEVVGRVTWPGDPDRRAGDVSVLGALADLPEIVTRHDAGLLLMTSEVPRLQVFEEVGRCLHLPVRLRELSGFYEERFGHVPAAEINAAWFQYIVHPNYRAKGSPAERALDVAVAGLAGLAALPLMLVLAAIIRRDGGPVLFRQVRIGEGGRPFTILKLRTMRVDAGTGWAQADDDRVTRIGRLLRKTHLDELPQVVNVLRGDMSVVGPRPEQPGFVDELEQVVPFYQRRHLLKPGLTGWAQVRCGYAGSEVGSAWKVCHDLYYLKHRSLVLNLVVLCETLRTLVADRQYTAEPASVDFILAPTSATLRALPDPASVSSAAA